MVLSSSSSPIFLPESPDASRRHLPRRVPKPASGSVGTRAQKRRRLPGLPVVLLSSISAAFLTVVCRPRQALTPSLFGLAAQTALARSVPVLRRPVRRGKPRSHAGLSSDFVHAATNQHLP